MLFIGLGRTIAEAHFGHWLIRSVVMRHALEQRASELANGFFGNVRQFLTVAQHDETADATLEIGLGAPCDLHAPVTLGRHAQVGGGGSGAVLVNNDATQVRDTVGNPNSVGDGHLQFVLGG